MSAPRELRITAIGTLFPLPEDMGGPVRFMGLIRALAQRHQVSVVAIRRPSTAAADEAALAAEIGGELWAFDAHPWDTAPPAWQGHWVWALARRTPPWILGRRTEAAVAKVAELARRSDAIVLLDDYAGALLPFRLPRGCVVVADKSNVMGWSMRERRGERRATPREALGEWLTRAYERRYLRRCAQVVVTSAGEGERLDALYGLRAGAVVASAVELPARPAARTDPGAVGWLGFRGYYANALGLERLLREGWGEVGAGATLHVVGGGAEGQLPDMPGVVDHGFVDDLGAVLDTLSAGVVPLWAGAGVKLKTLTLMAAGIPLAVTPVAIEGIAALDRVHCLIADDPVGLARALRRLLDDRELAQAIGARARALVAERYTWAAVGEQFRRVVEGAAEA